VSAGVASNDHHVAFATSPFALRPQQEIARVEDEVVAAPSTEHDDPELGRV